MVRVCRDSGLKSVSLVLAGESLVIDIMHRGSCRRETCLKDQIEGQRGGGSMLILRDHHVAVVVGFPVT
jgi:hypothetical protein